ncbi:hypothetical protein D3C86_1558550 [compost metagenome]
MITQLTGQHRGHALAVVADVAANPAHVQLLAGRQQRLQQQVAVILATRAISWAVIVTHQVKIHRRLLARVITIVHTQQTHHFEWDRTHRHQRAEVHRTGKKTLRQAALFNAGKPGFMHHTQRQRLVELRGLASTQPVIEQLEQLIDQQFFGISHRAEEHLQQRLQALDPEHWCGRLLQVLAGNFQVIKQGQQGPGQCRFQSRHFIVGLDAIQFRSLAGSVAQQHAAHTKAPGVLL